METIEQKRGPGEVFCWSCGEIIEEAAVVCVHCGVASNRNVTCPLAAGPTWSPEPKSKTTSVLLAVFLSFWSWLYTWRKDWPQFVVGAVLHCLVAPALFMLGAFVDVGGAGVQATLICVAVFLQLAVWTTAVIDAAATPSGWYANYPNVGWWSWDYSESAQTSPGH